MRDPKDNVIWSTDIGAGASFGVKVELPGRYSVCMSDKSGEGGFFFLFFIFFFFSLSFFYFGRCLTFIFYFIFILFYFF